jgi:hypothetical protein
MAVLGISLGTRLIGIAIVDEQDLADWNTCAFRESWSNKKLKKIIARLAFVIDRFDITSIAVKVPDTVPTEPGFSKLLGALNVLCERKDMKPVYYTLSALLENYRGEESMHRKELINLLIAYYPVLTQYKERNKHYYDKLFEAVAAAHLVSMKKSH